MMKNSKEFRGPFNVNIKKPYKPVFICYIDLIMAISFLAFTLLVYWNDLNIEMQHKDLSNFLPVRVIIYQVMYFIKFFIGIFYLVICFDDKKLNRSHSTGCLFWFRVFFDIIFFGGLLFANRYIIVFSDEENAKVGNVRFAIIISKVVIETILYKISVIPAFRRSTY